MEIKIATGASREIVDVTDPVATLARGLADGAVLVRAPHTTVALFLSELDDELRNDYLRIADRLLAGARPFAHARKGNPNTEAHALSAMLGTSVLVPVQGGALALGTYQRLLLFELDGPKERTVSRGWCWGCSSRG